MSRSGGEEAKIQKEIVWYLQDLAKVHDLIWTISDASANHKAHRKVLKKGWPDITVILPDGRLWLIEVKSPHGILSEEQEHLKDWCERESRRGKVIFTVARDMLDVARVRWWEETTCKPQW